jgi:hypothetical protein
MGIWGRFYVFMKKIFGLPEGKAVDKESQMPYLL